MKHWNCVLGYSMGPGKAKTNVPRAVVRNQGWSWGEGRALVSQGLLGVRRLQGQRRPETTGLLLAEPV